MTELAAAQAEPAPRRRSRWFPWGDYKVSRKAPFASESFCFPAPPPCKLGRAEKTKALDLSIEGFALNFVGMTGFEPATTRPPDVYSNRAELHPEIHLRELPRVWDCKYKPLFLQNQTFTTFFKKNHKVGRNLPPPSEHHTLLPLAVCALRGGLFGSARPIVGICARNRPAIP